MDIFAAMDLADACNRNWRVTESGWIDVHIVIFDRVLSSWKWEWTPLPRDADAALEMMA